MPQDLLIKVTSEFYTDKDIESAKNLLFDLCVKDVRNKIRKGADKRKQNIADIVSVLQRLNVNEMPRFVVHDLSRLPAIDLNSVDVTCMTQQLQSLKENGAFNASSVFNLHRDVEEVKDMIVLLTTQMTDLKQEISKNKTSTAPNASNVSSIWDIEAGLETVKQISASKPLPPGKDIGLHLGVPSAYTLVFPLLELCREVNLLCLTNLSHHIKSLLLKNQFSSHLQFPLRISQGMYDLVQECQ